MKKFVIGDIHGGYRALIQCFERSGFDKENDLLITLGDIVDGWSEVIEVVDELLTIKNRIDIRGNHDQWFVDWYLTGVAKHVWTSQGGQVTLNAYTKLMDENIDKFNLHIDKFFNKQDYYYLDDNNRLFVHGGFPNWESDPENISVDEMMWDRHMYEVACYHEARNRVSEEQLSFKQYNEVFIGHTSTTYPMNWRIGNSLVPHHVTNLWNLDQGGGWEGKLSIMDIDTKEYWQSDKVSDLYPGIKGRG